MKRHFGLLSGAAIIALAAQACSLPDLHLSLRAPTLPQTSFLYAANGQVITTLHGPENRVIVPYRLIPKVLRDAVMAIEDRRFYEHRGVDVKALVRAAAVDLRTGRIVQGGSTITEQLVKNTFVGPERTLARKVREAILAFQLEHKLTKNQILTRYLNTVYFGQGAYGVQAAAHAYFSRPVWKLDLVRSALLAGLISAPSDLDPVQHPDAALSRRGVVLDQMLSQGMIDRARYEQALRAPLRLDLAGEETQYIAPYFVDYVKEWFLSNPRFGSTKTQRSNLLFKGGLRIYTTLSPALQREAERAVNRILVYRSDPYGAMTVIDPRTGYIKAMVGGRDYFSSHDPVARVNLATGGITGRQAGSAFKPFALVAALEEGIDPQTTFQAPASITIPLASDCRGTDPVWQVRNYDGTGTGLLTIDQATIDSVNVVYAQLIKDLGQGDPCEGARHVVQTASRMGIRSSLRPVPSAVLGTNEVNTLEMASAYGTLATLGERVPPVAVTRITDASGRVVYQPPSSSRRAVSVPVAATAVRILNEVVSRGTGVAADIGRPAIGKTGTSEGYRDAWFVGSIPQLSAAVWVGFPEGQVAMVAPRVRIPEVLGGTWPAQIWHAFMVRATEHLPAQSFGRQSGGSVTVQIDVTRGCLSNRFTPPNVIRSVTFPAGEEPSQECSEPTTYQSLEVPSVIGMNEIRAAQILESSGFLVTVALQRSKEPTGTVIAQTPASGRRLRQTATVDLIVSGRPRVSVRDVVGIPLSQAVDALRAAGFGVAVLHVAECPEPTAACTRRGGFVWRERPSAQTTAPIGSTITLWANP